MSQISSDALELGQSGLPLIADIAQAGDLADLDRRCRLALAGIIPGAECALVWQGLATPGAGEGDQARLDAGEILPGGAGPGYVPIHVGARLLGSIRITPGHWGEEAEPQLRLLAALVGTTRLSIEALLSAHDEQLRRQVHIDIGRAQLQIQLPQLLEQIGLAIYRLCGSCEVGVVLRYKQSEFLELAYHACDGVVRHQRPFWKDNTGLSSVVMQEGRPISTDDYLAECARYGVQPLQIDDDDRTGYWYGAPLQVDGLTFGVINLDPSGGRLAPLQEELFFQIAREAAQPILNAQRLAHAERQARRFAALNQIARTINSSLDPEQVPVLIIEQAQQLLGAEESSLLLCDPTTNELVFSYASGPAGRELLGTRMPAGEGIAGYVAGSGQIAVVNDVRADGRFYPGADGGTGFTTRSLVAVPLRGIDGIKGVIEVVNRLDSAPFTEEDGQLLEAVADQALIALENAQRFARIDQALARRAQELDRSNDQLRKILRVSRALRAERQLDDLLQQIARAVSASSGYRSAVVALVQRERTAEPYIQRMVAAGPAEAALERIRPVRAPLARLQAILRPEFRRGSLTYLIDHRFKEYTSLWGGVEHLYIPRPAEPPRPGGWHPHDTLFSLLRDSRGELLGLLCVDDPEDGMPPSPEHVQILEIFANQAAVAIENARLYSDQQHSLQSMMALNGLGMALNTSLRSPQQIYELTAAGMVEMTEASWALVLAGAEPGDGELRPIFRSEGAPLPYSQIEELAREAIVTRRPASLTHSGGGLVEALVAIPLRATRAILGAVCVGYREGLPPAADLESLSLFANQAAVAVESVRLLAAVRQGRNQLASIMASTQEGMLLIGGSGLVAVANAAFQSLSDAERWSASLAAPDLQGMPIAELVGHWRQSTGFPAGEVAQLQSALESIADGSEEFARGQLNAPGMGGRSLEWTLLRATHAEGITNDSSHWPALLTLRDITAAKEAERLRQDLTNMIVHDLRSPLTSILTSIDMIFRGITGDIGSVQREILTIAYASAQHLLNMVNLLLDISRLEGGRMPLDRTPTSAEALVRRTVSRMALIAQNNGITVVQEVDPPNQLIYADGELVLRVLQNLLDNALKFSPKGSQVIISVAICPTSGAGDAQVVAASGDTSFTVDSQRFVRFAVRDHGVGIKAKDLEKIFQKFGQAGDRRGNGSGLGLTFCKLVVETHGGQIWVESTPGEGSTFSFTLPAADLHQ